MRTRMLIGLVVLLCWASISSAQSSTPPQPAPQPTPQPQTDQGQPVTEEITVVGLADSLREAVKVKHEAPAIVDAIAAKDVNKLPDKNLAEAVQRVPGVVINREFGEGERVSLRGVSPNLVHTTVNGHNVAVADWFVLEQLAATRSFNYLLLPSELIGLLTVYKSPTAELDEGGIGGTIDVKTRKPLDLKPFTYSGSVQDAYTQKSSSNDPNVTALVSWKNDAGNLGVLFSGVLDKRDIRRDGVEVLGYSKQGGLLVPDLIGSALFQQERERKAINGAVQFKPADRVEFNINGFWSRFGADNINQNYLAWGSHALGGGGTLTDTTVVGDTVVAGVISSAANGTQDRGVVYDAIDRKAFAKTWYADFDGTITPTDTWAMHFDVGYTKADGDTDSQPFVEFGAPAKFRYDLRGKTPQVQFLNIDPTNPKQMEFDFASLHHITNDDSEFYSYADAEKFFTGSALTSVKFGVKLTDHERKTDFQATTYGGFFLPLSATGCGGKVCTAADFAAGMTPGDFLRGIAAPGTLDGYWSVNRRRVESILSTSFNGTRIPNPPEVFSVEEKVAGGFAMANLKMGTWKGNLGLRVVRTDQTSTGNIVGGAGEISNAFGNFTHVSADRSYWDYLPSLNLSRNLNPELVLRLAAARTMARPDFTDVSPRVSLNPGALTGQGGDPNVDPFRANQADVSLEWYHGNDEIVSGALFFKDIRSFVTDRPVQQAHLIETTSPNLARCTAAPAPGFPNRYSCQFTINQRVNGGGGTVMGMELGLLKKFGGFGVQGNYTYSDAQADEAGLEIPGNSKHAGNVIGFFENERFGARLAYSYRSEFFVTFDRSTRLNQDSLKSLDASLALNIFRGITFTVDGVNLTNEKIVQFASDRFRPRAVYDNGRYYFIGFRFQG